MPPANAVDAASSGKMDWRRIDWPRVHRTVRRLQARIVKATRTGNWRKVRSLRRLLIHSFSARALAVKRVTENRGKRSPGVDGTLWSTPAAKSQAVQTLGGNGYRPKPLRRVAIPKRSGKTRPLGIPTMRDRAEQALHLLALEPITETQADPNSYGFRRGRSTADAMSQCYITLSRGFSPQWVLEGDITSCFDRISHDWMLDRIPMDKATLRKWLKAGVVHKGKSFPTEAGTPQGGILSPTLANRVLDGLEGCLEARFGRKGTQKAHRHQVNLIRYCDDFVITGQSKALLKNEVRPLVQSFLEERGLTLSEEKTRITSIQEGFDFLGWHFRKYDDKLLIKPSKANVKAFLTNLRATVKANKQAKQERLIGLLNPKIRGWANYHQGVVAKVTFKRVDDAIWRLLWQWAKRRHPAKRRSWITKRYFRVRGNRRWVFATETENGDWVALAQASDTPIRRPIKVKGAANPFDPEWANYFATRRNRKAKRFLWGKARHLW